MQKAEQEWTPLMVAAVVGSIELVELLIGEGADVNAMSASRKLHLMQQKLKSRATPLNKKRQK